MHVLLNTTYVCIYIPLTLSYFVCTVLPTYVRMYRTRPTLSQWPVHTYVRMYRTRPTLSQWPVHTYVRTEHTPLYLNDQYIRTYMRTYSTQHVRTYTFRLYVLCAVNTQTSADSRHALLVTGTEYASAMWYRCTYICMYGLTVHASSANASVQYVQYHHWNDCTNIHSVHTYICTYICTYVCMYIHM